ncbi:MAG: DUF2505 domain-containing protein [Austwickia sp.]|nr:MAG: DUF2505 domain-containing protein [Austwickia sp.]
MRLTLTLSYDAAPSRVGRMLLDEEFQRRVCAATGDAQARVTVTESGPPPSPARVKTARKLPTDRLPEAMRAIVGHNLTVVYAVDWPADRGDAGWRGDVVVTVEGKPVRLDATAEVAPTGAGTTITYDGELAAHLPFIGGKVERGVEPLVRSALEAEQRIGAQWLAEHPA